MPKIAWLGALTLLGLVGTACGDPCGDREDRLVPLSELPCNMTKAEGVWESHPFPPLVTEECRWLEFRGCSTYEIEHPLGRIPSKIDGNISVENDGRFYINQRPEQRQPLATSSDERVNREARTTKANWIAEMKQQQKAEEEQVKRWQEQREQVAKLISAVEVDGIFQADAMAAIDAADPKTRKDVVKVRPRESNLSLVSYTKLLIHLLEHDPHVNIQTLAASRLATR